MPLCDHFYDLLVIKYRQVSPNVTKDHKISEIVRKCRLSRPLRSRHPLLDCTELSLVAQRRALYGPIPVDQSFQRNLGAVSPFEFQGKFVWTNGPFALFSGKFVRTNGPKSSPKVSPETGIGPWMALPCGETC